MEDRQLTLPFPAVSTATASDLFFNYDHATLDVPAIELAPSGPAREWTLKQVATAFAETFKDLGYDAEWYIKDYNGRI